MEELKSQEMRMKSNQMGHLTVDIHCSLRCRLCAMPDNDMTDIFTSNETGKNILDMIDYCLPVVVKRTDTLPKRVCQSCLGELERCYRFHETVVKAEKQLFAFAELASIKLEETADKNYEIAQLCDTTLGHTECDDVEASLELMFSDVATSDEQPTTIIEEAPTADKSLNKDVLLSSLRPCSVLLYPIEFDCNNNPVAKSGRKGSSDSKGPRATHSGSIADGGEISTLQSRKEVHHKADLVVREQVYTLNQRYECTLCARVYANKKNLMLHYKLHNNEGLYSCQHCEESFTSRTERDCHHSSHVNDRPFKCTICEMAFSQRSKLKQHAIVHSNARNHACSVCDKSFKTLKARNRHMVVHTAEKPWECHYCKKHYKTEESLQRHLVEHGKLDIGTGPFSCEYCDKKFTNRRDKEHHSHVHTKERPFKCTICDMAFSHPSTLKEHTTTCHVNVRNYACSVCEESFKTLKARKRHMVVHTDEKPWECDYCKQHFKRKYSLQPHLTLCKKRPGTRKL